MIEIKSYDYHNLIRSYLAQDRPAATTAGDRLSYSKLRLYSYNSVLATISSIYPNTIFIDKYTCKCSNTTSKQATKLRNLIPYNWNVFTIDLNSTDTVTLGEYWEDITDLVGSYKRSRKYKHHIKQSIHDLISTAQQFARVHGLDSAVPDDLLRLLFVNQLLK